MKKKEILIIGSGFSALSCYSALENKFNVSLIDLPNNNLKEKYTFDRLFKPLLRVDGSIVVGKGGLSKVWKGVFFIPSKIDSNINLNKKQIIKSFLNLKKFFNFNLYKVCGNNKSDNKVCELKIIKTNLLNWNEKINYTNIISNKNNKKLKGFTLDKKINSLIKNKKLKFINGRALDIYEKEKNIFVEYVYNLKKNKLKFDYIFLAAGIFNNIKILRNKIKKENLVIYSPKKIISLIKFNKIMNNDVRSIDFPIHQINFSLKKKKIFYCQTYSFFQLLNKYISKKILNILNLNFLKKFGVAFCSIVNNYGSKYKYNEKVEIDFVNKKQIYSLFSNLNTDYEISKNIKFYNWFFSLKIFAGNHYGSLKYKNNKKVFDQYGRSNKLKRLSVIDGSIINQTTVEPPTIKNMINSYSLTKKIIKKLL